MTTLELLLLFSMPIGGLILGVFFYFVARRA